MNSNGKQNVKFLEERIDYFKKNNLLEEYDAKYWKETMLPKIKKDGLWGSMLKFYDGDKYSFVKAVKMELDKLCDKGQITEEEREFLCKKYMDVLNSTYVFENIQHITKPVEESVVFEAKVPKVVINDDNVDEDYSKYIPDVDKLFIASGKNFEFVDKVISEKLFFPMYIWGISGIGKTFQVEQSCANNKRPYFRLQITKDTTNEDLIGSYSLVNGNTVWIDGPVLKAYRSGGILLLDEIDLNPSLMILQGVLENKPLYVTQTGELVHPKAGFQVFATGNSKGDGNEYEYVGTSTLNKAFLERFDWIIEQKMPNISLEKRIMTKYMKINNFVISQNELDCFLQWIDTVRKSFVNGDTMIYISTRRIQSILKGYNLTKDFEVAIQNAMSHYDQEETNAFLNVWKAIYQKTETTNSDAISENS